jgi:hypothetical protein
MVCYLISSFTNKDNQINEFICIFLDESSFIHKFKHQISDLVLMINDNKHYAYMWRLYPNIFLNIYIKFTNLTHFHVDLDDKYLAPLEAQITLPSTPYLSNIVYLNIKVKTFHDCLWLVDGHLSQLHTFIVYVQYIYKTSRTINNTVRYLIS